MQHPDDPSSLPPPPSSLSSLSRSLARVGGLMGGRMEGTGAGADVYNKLREVSEGIVGNEGGEKMHPTTIHSSLSLACPNRITIHSHGRTHSTTS